MFLGWKHEEMNSITQAKRPKKIKPETYILSFKAAIGLALFLIVMTVLSRTGQAQQTIFNVPTTDVLDRGKVYFELDVSAKPNNSAAVNRFSSFVPRVVVGAGGRLEVGLNVTGNIQPGRDSTTLSPTAKWEGLSGQRQRRCDCCRRQRFHPDSQPRL